jgi:superfamily I DNA/RNA helicase
VVNLDKLMNRVISNAGGQHPGYKNGVRPVAQAALSALRKTTGARYRAVMVDKAQDFDTEALQFCVELLEATQPDEQDLVIVADSAQNIFRKNFRWKDAGIKAQGRARVLRVNYRNTREILEFAHGFLTADPSISVDEVPDPDDEMSIIPAESAERSGEPPTVEIVNSVEDEVSAVVDHVKRLYAPRSRSRSIAILYGEQTPGEKGYRPKLLARALDATSIPYFWVTDPGNRENKALVGSTDEPVILSTIMSAKGLEFPNTIVCGLGVREDSLTARKLLYVGFTRAVDHLTVITTKRSPFCTDVERGAGLVGTGR